MHVNRNKQAPHSVKKTLLAIQFLSDYVSVSLAIFSTSIFRIYEPCEI